MLKRKNKPRARIKSEVYPEKEEEGRGEKSRGREGETITERVGLASHHQKHHIFSYFIKTPFWIASTLFFSFGTWEHFSIVLE